MKYLYHGIGEYSALHWADRERRGLPTDPLTMHERYTQQIVREAMELLDEIPWKDHRAYDETTVVQDNILEEASDVIFTTFALLARHGLSYEQLLEAATVKKAVLDYRWKQEHDTVPLGKVALIDIDEVLCEWIQPFLLFAFPSFTFATMEEAYERVPMAEVVRLKHLFRQSGAKRHLPALIENVAATIALASAGYDIVLMSKRPVRRYTRLEGDTIFWLDQHAVPYRQLLFVEDKQFKVAISGLTGTIAFAVDDDPDNVDQLRDLGILTYWVGKAPYHDQNVKSMLDIPAVKEACK